MGKAVTLLNKPNETRYFLPSDGKWKLTMLPMKASTVLAEGAAMGIEIVSNTTTGNHTLFATENAAGADFVGIMAEPVIATDTDYATAGKLKGVRIPESKEAEAYFAVGAGTFTLADVGKTVEITTGSLGLSVDTVGKGARITGFISSTKGTCKFDLPTTETT